MALSDLKPNPRQNISVTHRTVCRMCASQRLEMVLPLGPTPLADAYVAAEHLSIPQELYPLDLYLCLDCGLGQVLEVVQAEALYVDYIYETKSSLGLDKHFDSYAESTARKLSLAPGSLVVDIGSNDGTLLSSFKSRGMKVLGVDPARIVAEAATKRGIPTKAAFFTDVLAHEIRASEGPASLITANNIFANADNLVEIVDGISTLLSDDGVFVFESFYLKDLIENMVFDFIYHEHLSAFSVTPVAKFFEARGLELFDVERVPTKGGSLRYFIKRKSAPRAVAATVAQFKQDEKDFGLNEPAVFKKFADKITGLKNQLTELLTKLRGEKKTIAGYGASATTTTLLYHFGITKLIDFIVDDYPVRHGLFSPGCHIPVLPSSELYTKRPDYTLIIAWRYVDPIVKQHGKYLADGGHFIVPVPQLRVL